MKKIFLFIAVAITAFATAQTNTFPSTGAAGIGTTTPNASSLLDITSTSKGILIPRMTSAQRNAIPTPAAGLLIYQINGTPGFYFNDGSAWTPLTFKGAKKSLSNLIAPTAINTNLLPGVDSSEDLGSLSFKWRTLYAANATISNDALIHGLTIGQGGGSNSNNTAVGIGALSSNINGVTGGVDNVAIGYLGLYSNTGSGNIAIGSGALYYNTKGHNNSASGYRALYSNTTGSYNVASGNSALYSNTTGIYNTASGQGALYHNTAGSYNVAIGTQALDHNTGDSNVAIGPRAFFNITAGSNNTAIGSNADVYSINDNISNATAIGHSAKVSASNTVVIGDNNVTVIGGHVGWSILSDGRFRSNIKEDVPGLEFIKKLKPVTYNLQLQKFDKFLGKKDSLIKADAADYAKGEKKIHTGFVAQEVEKAAKEIGYDFDGVNHPQNDKDNYSLVYADFVPSLVKAVQELSATNDAKDARIDTLQQQNNQQQKQIDAQQKQLNELRNLVLSIQQKQESCSPCSANSSSSVQTNTAIITGAASLQQNIPNPFNNTTTINYSIPQAFSSAKIIVTDKSGKALKEVSLTAKGKGSLQLKASTLSSGAYQYSLYVDGRLIDTKQMVLAR